LEAVFNDIDLNHSGSISLDEIKKSLPLLAKEDDKALLKMMNKLDLIDEKIPKDQFLEFMKF
jgi:Ca2+-binding EF-hand superfamily protein